MINKMIANSEKNSRQLGTESASSLIANLKAGGCVDEHMEDQVNH